MALLGGSCGGGTLTTPGACLLGRDPESRQWEGLEVSARPGEQARPGPGPAGSGGVVGAAGLPQGLGRRGSGFWARWFLWARPWVLDRSLRVFTLKLSVSTSLPSLPASPVPASPFAQWSAYALLAAPGATWSGLALRLWAAAGMLSQDSRVFWQEGTLEGTGLIGLRLFYMQLTRYSSKEHRS